MTGNLKESLIPYIVASLKQIKKINKAKKESQRVEPSNGVKANVEKLQIYAINYLKINNSNIQEEKTDKTSLEDVDQPEVESLMPSVSNF